MINITLKGGGRVEYPSAVKWLVRPNSVDGQPSPNFVLFFDAGDNFNGGVYETDIAAYEYSDDVVLLTPDGQGGFNESDQTLSTVGGE